MMGKTELFMLQVYAALAIARKDMRIYYLKPPVLIFGLLFPLFLFLAFSIGRDLSPYFLIPGLLGMVLFFTATSVGPVIAPQETRQRTLERLAAAPIATSTIIFGDILASITFGLAISLLPIILGVAILGIEVTQPVLLAMGMVNASLCFSAIGMLFSTMPTDTTANVMMLSTLIKFPLIFISGVFIPLDTLSSWGVGLACISPLTYFIDIARHCTGGDAYFPVELDLALMVVFTVVMTAAAIVLYHRSLPRRL